MNAWADYESAASHKLLSDNRDLYIAQSAATRDGKAAEFNAKPKDDDKEQES